ncbi:hypothetical protein TNIN_99311 [Trichonephila inaurata madagascariensis]|uniref:Uncharacterized protein n=1 Tax=Trichonephila inaurata madagascariensis TaxID=2747483 RepID=A0A8X6M9H9_9ARAC|nr:hypothetical protein TNIN_99311 [Trichonephila inaurata madagascariensis]
MSSPGLRQPAYKKRPPEVRRRKRLTPSSLSENQDRKRRPPIKSNHKKRLPSFFSLYQIARKRNKRMEENYGQVPARGSRPGPTEQRPLQSSRIP